MKPENKIILFFLWAVILAFIATIYGLLPPNVITTIGLIYFGTLLTILLKNL